MGDTVTFVGKKEKRVKAELKKHAATIHCSNTLSLLQRKISNALLYHAYQELMTREEHEISVKQLCLLIGYHGNNHLVIREALKELISTVIEWNVINDETGTENWTASSIIASVSLEGPMCYFAYSPRMKQLLHSPTMFGKVDLVIQAKFRSGYGLALYENCIRYRGLPRTKWIEMPLFRKLMGIPAKQYAIFRDFKRRVLDKAIEEVNSYSDLIIAAELQKEGRKVVRVRFSLKERAKRTRLGSNLLAAPEPLCDVASVQAKLKSVFEMTERQVSRLCNQYPILAIHEKIQLIETSTPFQADNIKNKSAYLQSALKHDYQPSQAIQKKAETNAADKKKEAEDALLKQIEVIRQQYAKYREQTLHTAINALSTRSKKSFIQKFYKATETQINTILQLQRKKYNRDNILESPQLQALLRQFALKQLKKLPLLSLTDFVQQNKKYKATWNKLRKYDAAHPALKE